MPVIDYHVALCELVSSMDALSIMLFLSLSLSLSLSHIHVHIYFIMLSPWARALGRFVTSGTGPEIGRTSASYDIRARARRKGDSSPHPPTSMCCHIYSYTRIRALCVIRSAYIVIGTLRQIDETTLGAAGPPSHPRLPKPEGLQGDRSEGEGMEGGGDAE